MKKVLITGGSRGIGRACVKLFCEAGYSVAFVYAQNRAAALDCEKAYGATAICGDISSPEIARETYKKAFDILGGVDVLVNNAGISFSGLVTDIADTEWRKMIDTNLSSAFYMCREASPYMINQKFGRIINIGSVWGRVGASCEVAYSAAKAGMRGLTFSLAKELGPSNITVNCIEPGVIDTDMNKCYSAEDISSLIEETPLCRIGDPEDVAQAVLFLASEKASFITAQNIGVDGGFGV